MLTLPIPRSKGTGDVDDALEDVPGWLCGLGLSKKCVVPLKHMCREMFDVFSFFSGFDLTAVFLCKSILMFSSLMFEGFGKG